MRSYFLNLPTSWIYRPISPDSTPVSKLYRETMMRKWKTIGGRSDPTVGALLSAGTLNDEEEDHSGSRHSIPDDGKKRASCFCCKSSLSLAVVYGTPCLKSIICPCAWLSCQGHFPSLRSSLSFTICHMDTKLAFSLPLLAGEVYMCSSVQEGCPDEPRSFN